MKQKFYWKANEETESFRVFEVDGVISDEGNEDAVVADFYQSTPRLVNAFVEMLNAK